MSPDQLDALLGADRSVTYSGYLMLAGPLAFVTLVRPSGRPDRRLVLLAAAGAAVLALGTVGAPLLRWALDGGDVWALTDLATGSAGAALLVRLAALAAVAFFLVDLCATAVAGWRSVWAWCVVIVIAGTIAVESAAEDGDLRVIPLVLAGVHVLAAGAWLGGLVAIIAMLAARDTIDDLQHLVPRFARVTMIGVITLAASGLVHALVESGGVAALVTSSYGLVLLIKTGLLSAMVAASRRGQYDATKIAFLPRYETTTTVRQSRAVHRLRVTMMIELALAFAVLGATSALVRLTPPV